MRIEKLRLRGMTGIKRGLGLEEISIDFSDISGLVAFEGQNGAGKSTVLDSLSPFPMLASRDGVLSHHVGLRNSEKELSFTYAGDHFRTLLKIDSESGKSEGYCWKNGKSEVNGKISQYSAYIQNLLGSPNLFFSSVFCAQNSTKLSEMTTGQLKTLFAEFLRLDRFQKWEDTAKQCANIITGQAGQLDVRLAGLRDRICDADNIKKYLEIKKGDLSIEENRRDAMRQNIVNLALKAESLKEIISRNALLMQRKSDIEATIVRLTQDMESEKVTAGKELTSLSIKYRAVSDELNNATISLHDREKILTAADRGKEVSEYLERQTNEIDRLNGEIACHQETCHTIELELAELRQRILECQTDSALYETEKEIAALSAQVNEQLPRDIEDLEKDRTALDLKSRIATLKEKMEDFDLKDPACQSTACRFIVGALSAAGELPALEKELGDRWAILDKRRIELRAEGMRLTDLLTEKNRQRADLREALTKEIDRLSGEASKKERELKAERLILITKTDALSTIRQNIAHARLEIAQLKTLSAKLPDIQVAEQRKQDLEEQLGEIKAKGIVARAAWDSREAGYLKRIEAERDNIAGIIAGIDQDAEITLSGTEAVHLIEKSQLSALEKSILESREKIAQLQGELARTQEAEKVFEAVTSEKGLILRDAGEWRYLQQACSTTGLQALEIDGTAPLISGYANVLLNMAFGPLFSVRLRTQDDERREVLDIVVIDENGNEDLLENKSGGERVWILKALRLAMTLLSKEKSGRNLETFYSDEEDGSLDLDNAKNFIALYRSFMQSGGFQAGIFISHRPECRNMADYILAFEPGKNPYWR